MSPRRLAIVALSAVAGWTLERFAGAQAAFVSSLLIGVVIARIVPAGGSCRLPSDPRRTPGANG